MPVWMFTASVPVQCGLQELELTLTRACDSRSMTGASLHLSTCSAFFVSLPCSWKSFRKMGNLFPDLLAGSDTCACLTIMDCLCSFQFHSKTTNAHKDKTDKQNKTDPNLYTLWNLSRQRIIIIIMEICKVPTLWLKALNKHTHIMYIDWSKWKMLSRK